MNFPAFPLLVFGVLASLGPPQAGAEVIGTDDFSYTGGIIIGQTGGTGWDWKNVAPAAHTGGKSDWDLVAGSPTIISGRLVTSGGAGVKREYNGPGEGLPPSDEGNGAVNDGNVHKAVYYAVTVTPQAGTTYWGVSSYDFGTERLFFGVPNGQGNFGIFNNTSGVTTLSTVPALPGRRYELVARVDFAADRISLYVNPDLSAPEAGNTPAATAVFTGTNWSTALRLASGGSGGVSWDNLRVVTAWADLQPFNDTTGATYVFNSDTRQITVGGGVVTSVEGTNVAGTSDMADAAEFRFSSNLYFDSTDKIQFQGSKPVRISVTGNITIPAGMTVSASATDAVPVAGGGTGAAASAGGGSGVPVPVAVVLGQMQPDEVSPFVLRIIGGAGGNGSDGVSAATNGHSGGLSYTKVCCIGSHGPPYSMGWVGIEGGGGGFNKGGLGFGMDLASLDRDPPYYNGGESLVQDPLAGGLGGGAGSTGGLFGSGTPGADGAVGAAGYNGQDGGNGVPGYKGLRSNDHPAFSRPNLIGGNGGSSGQGGGGGSAGYGGGSGGGGGGGGRGGDPFIGGSRGKGGNGGEGGVGRIGGIGGTGGFGGAGGAGGGAFELRATGTIRIAGGLSARGGDGKPGGAGTVGLEGEPVYYNALNSTQGKAGTSGESGALLTSGGAGGKGGDGGPGGTGGNGATGGHGAGGAGGAIVLRSTLTSITGSVDVAGGVGAPGHGASQGVAGEIWNLPANNFNLSPNAMNFSIARGASLPAQSFSINKANPQSYLVYQVAALPWWISHSPDPGIMLVGVASQTRNFSINSAVLGGGVYSFPVTVSDTDPASLTPSQTLMVTITVSGPPDDHFGELPGATVVPAAMNVTQNGNLETGGDTDLFKINITTPGTLELWTTGSTDTLGTLLDSNGQPIITNDDAASRADRNFRLVHDVEPGTYYVRVGAFVSPVEGATPITGTYVLHVNANPVILPAVPQFQDVGGVNYVRWDGKLNTPYRVLRSPDLLTWNYDSTQIYAGTGSPLRAATDTAVPRLFYQVVKNNPPAVAARIQSSSSNSGTAVLAGKTSALTVSAGVPGNFGDTALLLDGAPLKQEDGVLMATAGRASFTNLVNAPGQFTASPLPGFPANGSWLASSALGVNNETAGTPASLAWFPGAAGWMGGTFKGGDVATSSNYLIQNPGPHVFETTLFGPLANIYHTLYDNTDGGGTFPLHGRGACLVTGAADDSRLLVAGVRPFAFNGGASIQAYEFITWRPDGTRENELPVSWVYVPYTTPGIAAGQVNANGTVAAGTSNFSVTWNAATSRYQLTIPGMADLRQGALLVSAFDTNANCHFIWETPVGNRIGITASRLPLASQPAGTQCGFCFAWIPFGSLIVEPGP